MSKLQVYDPFRDVWNVGDEVGRLFWGLGHHRPTNEQELSFNPFIDVAEDEKGMTLKAELPGLKREDVKIKIREGILTLSGEKKFEEETKKEDYYRLERSYGNFARSFTLPQSVDAEKVKASMADGVLTLSIPKKPEAQEREVDISVQ